MGNLRKISVWVATPVPQAIIHTTGYHELSPEKKLKVCNYVLVGALATVGAVLIAGIAVACGHQIVTNMIRMISNPWIKGTVIGGASLLGGWCAALIVGNLLTLLALSNTISKLKVQISSNVVWNKTIRQEKASHGFILPGHNNQPHP